MRHSVSPDPAAAELRSVLHLLSGPFLTLGDRRVDPPEGCKRLLAILALRGKGIARHVVAGDLWPDVDRRRAEGNLRSALWRLHAAGLDIVNSDNHALALQNSITVDVATLTQWAQRVVAGSVQPQDLHLLPSVEDGLCMLSGWYDDWVIIERERLRHHLLQALETLSRRLYQTGKFAQSIDAALIAVDADPLRETAQQTLIEAHLAEGNLIEAHRARDTYRDLLRRELDLDLSPLMCSLISGYDRVRRPELSLVR